MVTTREHLKHAWSLFNRWTPGKPTGEVRDDYRTVKNEPSALSSRRQVPTNHYTVSSSAAAIFLRIAIDVSMIEFQHVKIDSGNETQTLQTKSSLNRLFTVEANQDQSAIEFMHNLVYNMFDDGETVAVPTITNLDPKTANYSIEELRIGKVIDRYRDSVKVSVYNPEKGDFSDIVVKKKFVAIIQNPLYEVLINGNPTIDRLLRKLSIVDKEDIDNIKNRMNMILELPIPVKGSIKKNEAAERVKELEEQLKNNKLGIAYINSNEKVTQLSKQLTSTLMDDIKYLKEQLLNELGLNENIFNGKASAAEMQNYYVRTIEPIAKHIQQEFQRKFITKTAYTQGHRINIYRDPFKLIDISILASTGDALIRNNIVTANEFRSKIGFGPHWAPQANMLYNPNIANNNQAAGYGYAGDPNQEGMYPPQEGEYPYDQNEGMDYEQEGV